MRLRKLSACCSADEGRADPTCIFPAPKHFSYDDFVNAGFIIRCNRILTRIFTHETYNQQL